MSDVSTSLVSPTVTPRTARVDGVCMASWDPTGTSTLVVNLLLANVQLYPAVPKRVSFVYLQGKGEAGEG